MTGEDQLAYLMLYYRIKNHDKNSSQESHDNEWGSIPLISQKWNVDFDDLVMNATKQARSIKTTEQNSKEYFLSNKLDIQMDI